MVPLSKCGCVLASAVLCALPSAVMARGSGGDQRFASPPIEFGAQPMYVAAPVSVEVGGVPGAEPVLVPLPPGVWAAMSGLAGLAVVAVWRKHRLREQ